MIKILIVGGTGFIGYHLANRAIKKGWKVYSISTKKPSKKRFLSKVIYIICDITKKKDLRKKIKIQFDYIVNLGGYVNHSDYSRTLKSHYYGCKNLVELFIDNPPKKFVQIGSSTEYGNAKSPHTEKTICKPLSIYGKAKLLSTKYLLQMLKKKDFPVVILRLYQAYGPKQDANRIIPQAITSFLENIIFDTTEGKQLRDFIYIDDVIRAIINSLLIKKSKGKIINIGTGQPRKIRDVIMKIFKIIKKGKPNLGQIKMRKDETLKIYPSIKKANTLINWSPKISFIDGLNKTIKSYEK
tara:strand:- start:1741 stop:2634 length:894 start_codon:yes stop_codon:yes gene_type:complete